MNKNDLNALNFREELIQLCKKYKCELNSSGRDDGDIYIGFENAKETYILKDDFPNKCLVKEVFVEGEKFDYKYINIMDKYIAKSFDQDSGKMAGLNNIKVSCGILTDNSQKAKLKMQELYCKFESEVKRFVMSRERKEIILNNGERYVWIKLNSSSRGYRCGKIIIDRDLTLEQLHEIVLPMCYACGRDDVEIF